MGWTPQGQREAPANTRPGFVACGYGSGPDLPQNSNTRSNRFMGYYKVAHLTERQESILRCIRQTIADQGEAPTVREIGAAVDLTVGSVHYQLRELAAKSAIVREPGRPRGIRLA